MSDLSAQSILRGSTRATKRPGAVSRPGATRHFQFRAYTDLVLRVKEKIGRSGGLRCASKARRRPIGATQAAM